MKTLPGIVAFLSLLCVGAAAKPLESTKYRYYAINGDTPGEIYAAMVRKGPNVNGASAYGATVATISRSGRLRQGKSCRIDGYQVKIDFVINLPRLSGENALAGKAMAKWEQFKSFVKAHEETHRGIWLGCARDLEARSMSLSAPSCATVDNQANQLFAKVRADCQKKHAALDAADQKRLPSQPFYNLVFGGRTKLAVKN